MKYKNREKKKRKKRIQKNCNVKRKMVLKRVAKKQGKILKEKEIIK
jgi:hypothetical protein